MGAVSPPKQRSLLPLTSRVAGYLTKQKALSHH
nr:MAG TPA: hypothetical protein [Caudoviricetes sp.]